MNDVNIFSFKKKLLKKILKAGQVITKSWAAKNEKLTLKVKFPCKKL